jgi:glutaminyl-peptide cyclotransferase
MLILCLILAGFACGGNSTPSNLNTNSNKTDAKPPAEIPVYSYTIVNKYPHDGKAFTQGLVYHDGFLYESTGEEGQSSIRKVDISSGKVLQKRDVPSQMFAEGLEILGDKFYQLTWQDGVGFTYHAADLSPGPEFRYNGEGWGLATDGTYLIMSDGTHILKYLDPTDFTVVKRQPVMQDTGKPLFLLNELECVKGEIWANIWHSEDTQTQTAQGTFPNIGKANYIARIDPASGKVVGWIDLGGISPTDQFDNVSMAERPRSGYEVNSKSENTLNGIAYDEAGDRIFVTGKNWKNLYEIKIIPKEK